MKKKNNYALFGIIGVAVIALLLMMIPTNKMQLSGNDFLEKYKTTQNAVLLDVRTPGEFSAGHIDGAINIDYENQSFTSEIKKLDTSKTYFVYCRSGNRSGKAISIMKASGLNNIYELRGGIVSNKDSISLVNTTSSNKKEEEYVVDGSDMLSGLSLIEGIKKTTINDKEKTGLIRMREEEKLARDVYTTLGNVWGVKMFSNIANSEQTHTAAIKVLIDRYDIIDPVINDNVGVFQSKEMQQLYDKLISQGKVSLKDAFIVGATVEDLDINDLENLKKETSKEDILITYNNLQKGSRNHLRAFVRNIQSNGISYTPQYISTEMYNTIISSPQEKGRY